jgi:hypothetical protein
MSTNFVKDISDMHTKFGVNTTVNKFDKERLTAFLDFRIGCLQEELDELKHAENADDAVDALIDLIVFAVGTLDVYQVDSVKAWQRVYDANIVKEVGIKEGRPNPFGLPDLIKPEGWVAPSHVDNVGLLDIVFAD